MDESYWQALIFGFAVGFLATLIVITWLFDWIDKFFENRREFTEAINRAKTAEAALKEKNRELDAAHSTSRDLFSAVSAKDTEISRLQSQLGALQRQLNLLQQKHATASAQPSPNGRSDKFAAVKRRFASLYHPDGVKGTGIEKLIREEIIKEFWRELEQIERST